MRDCDYEKEVEARGQEDGEDKLRWTTICGIVSEVRSSTDV